METKHTPEPWNLEEIPYETNDISGGWYLHFSPDSDALYISRAVCSETNARLIEAAPKLLDALKLCFARLQHKADTCNNASWRTSDQIAFDAAKAAIRAAEGGVN